MAGALIAVAALATIGLVGPASASTVLVVDVDGMGSATNCNDTAPASPTIQAAVTLALPGDTVIVCPGTYAENVVINKSITLKGAKAGTVAGNRSGTLAESVVDPPDTNLTPTFDVQADNVTIDGFYFTGNENNAAVQTSPAFSGYLIRSNVFTANVFGLYFNASGGNPSLVTKNYFRANNENLGIASAAGNGIYSDQGLAGATIQVNKFRNNINAAILIALNSTSLTASGNNSLGDGIGFGQFGGSGSRVINNTISHTNGSGIFITNTSGVAIQNNRVSNSTFSGIRISDASGPATSIFIQGNTTNHNGDQGISVSSATSGSVNVRGNTASYNNGDGILFSAATKGNTIKFNSARHNGNFDCEDQSTGSGSAGTANLWQSNHGTKSSPPGLCSP